MKTTLPNIIANVFIVTGISLNLAIIAWESSIFLK